MRSVRIVPIFWAVLIASGALILGYVGHRTAPFGYEPSDALYAAMQLFALGGVLEPQSTPWEIEVARFLAPLAVAYATLIAIATVLREQLQRYRISRFAKDHVVVIGLGRTGVHLSESFKTLGHRVVVVESDSANTHISALRDRRIAVLVSDATHPVVLRTAAVARASHVVVVTGDDSRNLEIAERVQSLAGGSARRTTLHVAIAEQGLWLELGRLHLGRARPGVHVEFFHQLDRAAQCLVDAAERHHGGLRLPEVFVDGDDSALSRRVHAHLRRRAEVAAMPSAAHVGGSSRDEDAPVVLVCRDDSDSEAVARGLSYALEPARKTVCVAVRGRQSEALFEMTNASNALRLVSVDANAMAREFLRSSGLELMARVRHEHYVAQQTAQGDTNDVNPSLVPWDELPESLKESNRQFAESLGTVVDAMGGQLVPLRDGELAADMESSPLLEALAENEHSRWMEALLSEGWRYAPGPKDPKRKTHPLLVRWTELPEAEKEKDRDAIRAVPHMLARVGYTLKTERSARQS